MSGSVTAPAEGRNRRQIRAPTLERRLDTQRIDRDGSNGYQEQPHGVPAEIQKGEVPPAHGIEDCPLNGRAGNHHTCRGVQTINEQGQGSGGRTTVKISLMPRST